MTQTETFERIFPTVWTESYLGYMATPSYYDLLLNAWEHKYIHEREIERERERRRERDRKKKEREIGRDNPSNEREL